MSEMFNKVGGLRAGYAIDEVDDFMARARASYEGSSSEINARSVLAAAFSTQKGGYKRVSVDATLDRLAAAFVKRDRADYVARHGQQAWLDHVADRATVLYPRLSRPEGERFTHPEKGESGYSVAEVDAFLTRVVAFFNEGQPLSARDVRNIVFKAKRGDKAYSEVSVDAYLNALLEVMLAVE
ncbi:cell division protein DivIVA [Boudabousia marimammalium]|uniref:Cell division protein DivIVA n=1 Tax=Boudabousia marimammalium TaxID=156892 RepID=A0A1Q5PNX1_9ACTO|nr:cell division protein DivIVA [Boudabousia marimammalium]OKL49217.1 cell division protein DivIVA [Boudabousia marimammalium]